VSAVIPALIGNNQGAIGQDGYPLGLAVTVTQRSG
jgi:hypothetical protein